MKNMLRGTLKNFVFLFVLILFSVFVLWISLSDAMDGATKIAQENLTDDAKMFTLHLDKMLTDKMEYTQQLAKSFAQIGVSQDADKTSVNEMLSAQQEIFQSVSVLDLKGGTVFGDTLSFDITKESIYNRIVYQRQTEIYDQVIYLPLGDPAFVICSPICKNNATVGILLCTVGVKEINAVMDSWGYSQQGCCVAISENGRYMTGGKKYNSILKGEANNFFTYIHNATILNSTDDTIALEEAINKDKTVSMRYKYDGSTNFAVFCSSQVMSTYYVFISTATSFSSKNYMLSAGTLGLLGVLLAIWITWLIRNIFMMGKMHYEHSILELFKQVSKREKAIIFEFQPAPKRLNFYGDSASMFGMKLETLYGEAVYDIYNYVHEDDASIKGRLHRFIDGTETDFNAEIRIRNVNNEYAWYRIAGMLVQDNRYGLNQRFIGKIESADKQITEERDLMQRAENDLLTGVLNKKTMEEKVTECLQSIEGGYHYIFFMIDLDNFKNVNDNLGHIMGDQAIVDTADCLVKVFPKNAFVGRLGGDEFAVCVAYDAFDTESLESFIRKKAKKICEVNTRTYRNNDKEVQITSSVGIALAPDFTDNFEMLYSMADRALYRSKNGGKNCYHLYRDL